MKSKTTVNSFVQYKGSASKIVDKIINFVEHEETGMVMSAVRSYFLCFGIKKFFTSCLFRETMVQNVTVKSKKSDTGMRFKKLCCDSSFDAVGNIKG